MISFLCKLATPRCRPALRGSPNCECRPRCVKNHQSAFAVARTSCDSRANLTTCAYMRCPQCHTDHDHKDRFCESCGAQLGRACAGCGQPLKPQARFCGHCGTAAAADPERRASDDVVLADAERRQLTVLFCDLVGSTEIASRLDPEDWGDIITQYQRDATAVIEQFGGHVAKYLGDGLLVFFGYPRAHQGEAERAVRAALALLDAMARLNERVAAAHSLQ